MQPIFTTSNITFILGMLAVLFSIYNFFKDPQEALDKRTAVEKEEADGKSKILEQRVQWEKESSDKRFIEMGVRLSDAMTLAQNHTHTVDVKVDKLIESVNALAIQVGKLETRIDERIPRKI